MTKSSHRPSFVVFEGLDGSGKTTCAQVVAKLLGATYLTTPCPSIRKYRDDLIGRYARCQEACHLFYLSTVFEASREAREILSTGRSVVLDRYFLSTQAYAAFRGSELDLDDIGSSLLPADLTVYLDAPLEIRRERLAARGKSAADEETLSEVANARLRAEHTKRAGLSVVGRLLTLRADTSADSVARTVVSGLRGRIGRHRNTS